MANEIIHIYRNTQTDTRIFDLIKSVILKLNYDVVLHDYDGKSSIEQNQKAIIHGGWQPLPNALFVEQLLDTSYWVFDRLERPEFIHSEISENQALPFVNNLSKKLLVLPEFPYPIINYVLIVLDAIEENHPVLYRKVIKEILLLNPDTHIVLYNTPDSYIPPKVMQNLIAMGNVTKGKAHIDRLLADCDYVITYSNDISLRAMLHGKKSVIFTPCGYDHITRNFARDLRIRKCLKRLSRDKVHMEKYLYWLFRCQSVNIDSSERENQILQHVQAMGW